MKSLFPAARTLALALAAVAIAGCGGKTVTRIDSDTTVDLSGRWNDTDSRLVSEEMIHDCLEQTWLRTHMVENSKKPVVIVGAIRNKSMEHIPVETFIKDIERAFINSGRVTVVADAGDRVDIRAEREAMQGNTTPETLKKFGREVGADYVMVGTINQIIDVESNVKVWLNQKKIKKFIGKGRYSG